MKKWFLLCMSASIVVLAMAQKNDGLPPIQVQPITPADFETRRSGVDSVADAVVLSDIGQSYFKSTNRGWFQLIHERVQRIKILTKNGIDAANFVIPQYKFGTTEEKIVKLSAITYNLNGSEIEKFELEEKDIFTDKINKYVNLLKFGLPNAKEGSILEVSYTIASDNIRNLRSWDFQGTYPRLHSEYTVAIPKFFYYLQQHQGNIPYKSRDSESEFRFFSLVIPDNTVYGQSSKIDIRTYVVKTRYVMENVPGLKAEPFTTTTKNHISKVDFYLNEYRFDESKPVRVMVNWPKMAELLLQDEDFGLPLEKNVGWVNAEMSTALAGKSSDADKAHAIFDLVRDHFTATDDEGSIYWSESPKTLWKNMKGTQSDINLMLTLFLQQAGLKANPVILSTRDHGFSTEIYPILQDFNYVISRVMIDKKEILLDASCPVMGFGHLPAKCYNGHSRNIVPMPVPSYLYADSIREQKTTLITINRDEEGKIHGTVSSRMGYFESTRVREQIKESGEENLKIGIKNKLPAEVEIETFTLKDLKNYDKSVTLEYAFQIEDDGDDLLYINPLMGEGLAENPFTEAERMYPVEMNNTSKQTIICNIQIPEGYVVDELPKSTRVKLEEGGGMYEYLIQATEGNIQLRSVIDIKRATFLPQEYNELRELFTYIMGKQNEQIVLKKQ